MEGIQSATSIRWGVLAASLGWLALAQAAGPGCATEREPAAAPDTRAPAVEITSPLPDATVVDSVAVAVAAEDETGVARVTLLVDGATCATRYAPPWILAWDTSVCADSSHHALQAEAVDPAGNLAVSCPITVRVLLNQAPSLTIAWPPDRVWLAVDRAGPRWRCEARDPEDGPLAAEAITWRLDGATICAGCLELDPPPVAPGEYRLAVSAQDRWGRRRVRTQQLTAFTDPGRASPEATWATFLCALRARAPQEAAACLAEDFALHAPEQGRPVDALRSPETACALAALAGDSLLEVFTLACHTGPVELFEARGCRHAKLDLRDLCLTASCRASADTPSGAPAGAAFSFEISGSAARVYLRAGATSGLPGAEQWSLAAWWDLHGSTWATGGGRGLTWLLLDALQRDRAALPPGG